MATLVHSVLLIFVLSHVLLANAEEVMVTTSQGKLLGVKLYTADGNRAYYSFSNIPYAKAPLANLRFKPPQNPTTWKGVRVVKFTPICYQWLRTFETSSFFGQEDCLYINVFTPVIPIDEKAKLPVVVCIHGGDFQRGSSYDCPANNFMEKNVVFVSFNYRLGIFGFASASDKLLPGNAGLKDQVAALKWVQKNIKSFGGDPDRVTIMGTGAGACSVHYHLYSPLSKGLFHSAISQSGSALLPWAFTLPQVARNRTLSIANLMNCPNDTIADVFMCLSKVQSKALVEAQPKLSNWYSEPNVIFSPTIEPSTVDNAFLSKNPWTEPEENLVPWIIGFNAGEGVMKSSVYFGNDEYLLGKFNNETDKAIPIIVTYDVTANLSDIPSITKAIKKFYLDDQPVTARSAGGLINLFTDSMIAYGTMKAASRYTGTKYFYLFDHVNQQTYSDLVTKMAGYEDYKMASHGDEMVSLLYVPWSYFKKDYIQDDVSVSRRMLNYWTNFIEQGNPNGKNKVIWQPMKSDKFEHLKISTKKDTMQTELIPNRYKFWNNLPLTSNMNQKIQLDLPASTVKDEL